MNQNLHAHRASQEAAKDLTGKLTIKSCEKFLAFEARLLDEARFDDWLGLFLPDAKYWVPSEPHQESPYDTVSLMYDDRRLLETRVRRLASPESIHKNRDQERRE